MPRVLMVFAHADDETLLAGALIAKLVSVGHEVKVLCLAPGGGEQIQRLRNACEVLGVSAVETLRYAGGAMWPDDARGATRLHENPGGGQTLAPVLATAPPGDVAGRIGGRLSEYDPDLVITHSRYGDYGHADHAATHQATLKAFEATAGERARLYALAWPNFLVSLNSRLMKIGGHDIRRMGPDDRFDLALAARSAPAGGASVTIEVAEMLRLRRAASRWYSDEISRGPLPLRILERLPIWLQRTVLGRARLTLLRAPMGFSPGVSRKAKTDSISGEYL